MDQILREKAEFISKNKNIILDNLGVVGYDLFVVLNKDVELSELKEYKTLKKFIESKKKVKSYQIKDESSIIMYLSSLVDKTCKDFKTREKYKSSLDRYRPFFNKEKGQEKTYVNSKKSYYGILIKNIEKDI